LTNNPAILRHTVWILAASLNHNKKVESMGKEEVVAEFVVLSRKTTSTVSEARGRCCSRVSLQCITWLSAHEDITP
jgi:hypothetical protein